MMNRGPPGFKYNSTEYLSVSAVKPGAAGPTRDRRAEAAERASQARAEDAQKITAKLQQERRIVTALVKKNTVCVTIDSKGGFPERPPGAATTTRSTRVPRIGGLAEQSWREALEAKARAIAASPREGKYGRKRGLSRRTFGRAAAVNNGGRMFLGVRVPSDALDAAIARRNDLDALPGELESLIFPQRSSGLSSEVWSSPIRHAVAFQSKQPRIVCYDPQRETRGWDEPGAYEWDDRPDDPDIIDSIYITDGSTDAVSHDSAAPAATDSGEDKGTTQTGNKASTEDGGRLMLREIKAA
eukprot:jgi/Undpi1/4774/HiC_scaffold_18.g08127.m1